MVVKFKEQITNFEFDIDDLKKMAANMKGKFNQLSEDHAHTSNIKLNKDIFEKTKESLEGNLT
jgi:predicted ATP-grasp superfamily ATP-dependent carboligase